MTALRTERDTPQPRLLATTLTTAGTKQKTSCASVGRALGVDEMVAQVVPHARTSLLHGGGRRDCHRAAKRRG